MREQHTPDLSKPCVIWQGRTDKDGYGRVQANGKWKLAHRIAFENEIGAISNGMVIDHLCKNRLCVNTLHMEIVSNYENVMRGDGVTAKNAQKVFCDNGHKLFGENLGIRSNGNRFCKECARARWRAYRARKIENGTWSRT